MTNFSMSSHRQEIEEFGMKSGAEVFFAPGSAEYSHFVFVEALRK